MAAAIEPSWPKMPVSWVISGTVRPVNHMPITRSTLMNVIASPAPTSTRATMAVGTSVATARRNWPAAIVSAPARIIRREPNRSSATPTGTCSAAYTASCSTRNSETADAPAENRSCASTAATPSEARWNTATAYAVSATSHTT